MLNGYNAQKLTKELLIDVQVQISSGLLNLVLQTFFHEIHQIESYNSK